MLFHSDGDSIGQSQEFPPPNNMNRKMRSIANIERIGLFAPQERAKTLNGMTATSNPVSTIKPALMAGVGPDLSPSKQQQTVRSLH